MPIIALFVFGTRPEAVSAGTARLVATNERRIVEEAEHLLEDPHIYQRMARRHNPYGDGKASKRIAEVLAGGTAEFARIRLGDLVPVEIQRQASCS
jgi:UDP-N-acetylglucosamine 2-epimerase (non-hydrolysing)